MTTQTAEMIVGRKYKILEMIGSGCFGSIMKGDHMRPKETVAIKIEKNNSDAKVLKHEARVYLLLNKEESSGGFPNIRWFGKDEDFFYMVLDLLGPSTSSFKQKYVCQNSHELALPMDMVFAIGKQIIERLRSVHNTGLIHRDIKPDNFLFGLGRNAQLVYLIDFGFCKSYLTKDNAHCLCKNVANVVGTPNFVSVNMHNRISSSRRDDLESSVYVLIYLLMPLNEWNVLFKPEFDEEDIKRIKLNLDNHDLIPMQIKQMLKYCRSIEYDQTPDYSKIASFLRA